MALEAEPANVKALFRRATARVSGGDAAHAAQARADLEAVCELQPRNAAAQALLRSPMLMRTRDSFTLEKKSRWFPPLGRECPLFEWRPLPDVRSWASRG